MEVLGAISFSPWSLSFWIWQFCTDQASQQRLLSGLHRRIPRQMIRSNMMWSNISNERQSRYIKSPMQCFFCKRHNSGVHWLVGEAYKNRIVYWKWNVCSYQQRSSPKSNLLNYTTLESYPPATVPLANQSQQIAAVNISDSTDLNKDILIISPPHSVLE